MKTSLVVLVILLATAGCSDVAAPGACVHEGPALGRPDLDLAGALRAAGATVEEQGIALDLKVFIDVPTEVLSVNGHRVLQFRFCTGDELARAVGRYGVGVYASSPPDLVVGPDHHLFAVDRVLATYEGTDGALLDLLARVMGPEIPLPRS